MSSNPTRSIGRAAATVAAPALAATGTDPPAPAFGALLLVMLGVAAMAALRRNWARTPWRSSRRVNSGALGQPWRDRVMPTGNIAERIVLDA